MIQISQTVLQPALQVAATDEIHLRGWYTNSFVAGNGITSVQGGNGREGFYYDIVCSLNGDGFVVIPAFNAQETTLSNPTAGFFGQLFINGSPGQMVFGFPQATAGWQIPTIYGDVVSFDQLARYNAAVQLLIPPLTFLTADETIAEINRIAGELSYAGVGVLGRTELSTAPSDPSHPIALSVTDTSVGDLHGSLTENFIPRATDTKDLGDSLFFYDGVDSGCQTLNYVQLGDFGVEQNGSRVEVNDNFGLAKILAGGDGGNQYAGVVASADGVSGTVEVQATSYSYLKNTSEGVVVLGDGAGGHNGTTITIDDVTQRIKLTNLPTADPAVAGVLWRDGTNVKISLG